MAPADRSSQRPKTRLSRRTSVNEHVVVDDFPADPPVSDRELAVIEAHLHDVLEIIEKIMGANGPTSPLQNGYGEDRR
jgi:hypothetical protein